MSFFRKLFGIGELGIRVPDKELEKSIRVIKLEGVTSQRMIKLYEDLIEIARRIRVLQGKKSIPHDLVGQVAALEKNLGIDLEDLGKLVKRGAHDIDLANANIRNIMSSLNVIESLPIKRKAA